MRRDVCAAELQKMGIAWITDHAIVRFYQLIDSKNVEDSYSPNYQDRKAVPPRILENLRKAKILTTQQAQWIVNTRTRVSVSLRCAIGNDFNVQTEGAQSFYGTIYDDGYACYVVDDKNLITIIVPDSDQRQQMEEFLERGMSRPSFELVQRTPDPSPFELCLIESGRVDTTCTQAQLDWWISRFYQGRKPHEVQILVSEGFLQRDVQMIRKTIHRHDARPEAIQFLDREMQESSEETGALWHEMLHDSIKAFRHTVIICSKPNELLFAFACLLDRGTLMTEEEKRLPQGLIYAVDPEIHAARKLSSFHLLPK